MPCSPRRPEAVPDDASPRLSGPARPEWQHQPNNVSRKPPWLKVRVGAHPNFMEVRNLVHQSGLHTVCESAACPNIGECWSNKALTFMILGNVCTRSCGFCDVLTGKPGAVDADEPRRVALALSTLGLRYTVITSVDRDDLPDGGADIWAQTIRAIHQHCPDLEVEVLTPDFKGNLAHLDLVLDARPDVFAHNIETVERLHAVVRPQARYARSLSVLRRCRDRGILTKTGMMLGLGERFDEVVTTMRHMVDAGVQILSLGQYLRPSDRHLPIDRWVHPDEFAMLKETGESLGLEHVEAGPLVRSSYRADMQTAAYQRATQQPPTTP
jgi:lipoic acid synthetase